ncbi:HlyD family efflux transporter periplasmic adaptor subunit [Spirosoma sp.]|uniref:HlyD family efflux transporter periplasmic adaptor subunit n=1 Tax=Spirosoma sp. TaxID=1899569 RepID=UPI00262FB844|nr:HlyD family efflux transporter periplasmic adaptor subunit [Spirosoma sp.]MCX6214932.1 HlyD family efflux transporter periplasmic adaptor subunit [Spirosoma sp.]
MDTLTYLPTISTRSQLIYTTILLSVLGAVAALPFIYVDVSVRAGGLVRPVAERSEVKAQMSGNVAVLYVHEGQTVKAGQPLLRLQSDMLDTKLHLLTLQQGEKLAYIHDLEKLTSLSQEYLTTTPDAATEQGLNSPLYRQQYEQLRFLNRENQQTKAKRQRELEISQKLLDDKVIARNEHEDKEFTWQSAVAQHQTQVERQRVEWQQALAQYRLTLTELKAQERQLRQEQALYTLKAPVGGTVSQLTGRYAGSVVQAGEVLGIVSPDSTLIVECYVPPKDIGLLRAEQSTRFQVEAFDYNQWGMVDGKVIDVANDFSLLDKQQPAFKVRCQLNQSFLQLPNGYRGQLKKGMTVQARFTVTRRSLFQLLYDKADDWLNPTRV